MTSSNRTFLIFLTTAILLAIGVVMVCSASAAIAARDQQRAIADASMLRATEAPAEDLSIHNYRYLKRQAMWVVIGVLVLYAAYHFDYERYRRLANVPTLPIAWF